jgi:hypothetical protein
LISEAMLDSDMTPWVIETSVRGRKLPVLMRSDALRM